MRSPLFPSIAALALAVAPSLAACATDDSQLPIELRDQDVVVRIDPSPFAIHILDASGKEVLRTLGGDATDATGTPDATGAAHAYGGPGATRDDGPDGINVLPGWDGYKPDERPWTHGAAASLVARTAATASFAIDAGRGRIALDVSLTGAEVHIHLAAHDAAGVDPADAWNKTTLAFALKPDEHFFGMGERYASTDHRGISMYSWAEEGGLGAGESAPAGPTNPYPNGPSMAYFPVPFTLSSAGYAIQLATTYRTEMHFGSERADAWRVAANTTDFETVVYVHADPLASLDDFTRDTGRPFVPAPWVFGPMWNDGPDTVADGVPIWQYLREKHVPTTTFSWPIHFLPASSQLGHEAEVRAFNDMMHGLGFKTVDYNNPYVAIGVDAAKADADYLTSHGLFATNADGTVATTSFISGTLLDIGEVDLTVPEGVAWFQGALQRSLDAGFDGWMHDFGEYTRRGWHFGDGRTGDAVHNQFPVLSAKAAHDLLVKERPDDFLFFVRSGYTGSTQYVPAVWGGDAEASFDETQGIPSVIRGGLNLGMSGVAMWGSDTSGFKCITDAPHDKEMYVRWSEVSAVSPFMEEEPACSNPVGAKKTKWHLWDDAETTEIYGKMASLHTRLAPYFWVLVREANRTGTPITRHPFLLHPEEPETWKTESSFYLGPSLYASPVVARGATSKDTWLPPGTWVDLDDHVAYQGGRHVTLPAPLGKLPLLVKDGGIVPMLDASIDTLVPSADPSVVTLDRVSDRLDVVVALSVGQEASITLADGTELVARRVATPGEQSKLPEVEPWLTDDCDRGCAALTDEGTVQRARVTTPLAAKFDAAYRDLQLHATGPSARRFRWDVSLLR